MTARRLHSFFEKPLWRFRAKLATAKTDSDRRFFAKMCALYEGLAREQKPLVDALNEGQRRE